MGIHLSFLFVSLTGIGLCQPTSDQGRLAGKITDDSGKSLAGATVTLHRNGDSKPLSLSVGADGQFIAPSIPPGTYRLCVQGSAGSLLLDPCLWAETPPTFTVRQGLAITAPETRIETGAKLQVRVLDPGKHLEQKRVPGAGLAGVWTSKKLFYPMRAESTDRDGTTYQMVVPYEQDLTFGIPGGSIQFQVAGKATDSKSGVRSPMRLNRGGGANQIVTIAVTGSSAQP